MKECQWLGSSAVLPPIGSLWNASKSEFGIWNASLEMATITSCPARAMSRLTSSTSSLLMVPLSTMGTGKVAPPRAIIDTNMVLSAWSTVFPSASTDDPIPVTSMSPISSVLPSMTSEKSFSARVYVFLPISDVFSVTSIGLRDDSAAMPFAMTAMLLT